MSKGDRRNFKLFARLQDGNKNYILLFDAIDKQERYDEKRILRQFEGERFVKQFSVAKNYLYNFILKTLDIFQSDPHSELAVLIHKVELLLGKNLFDQAQKLLRKAKHMAIRQERFGELLDLLNHERQILHHLQNAKKYEVFIQAIQEEEKGTLAKLANYQKFIHLYDSIYRLKKKAGSIRGLDEEKEVDLILAHPLLSEKEQALSVRAQIKQLGILDDCQRLKQNYKACLKLSGEMIEVYEQNADIRKEKNLSYIETLHNYGIFLYQLGEVQDSVDCLEKLRNTVIYTQQEKIKVFELYFTFKLGLCFDQLDLMEGKRVIQDFESELPKAKGKLMKSAELLIYYFATLFYIWTGEFSEALIWVNRILNEPKTEFRTDLQCMARILNLVIHFELGNRDLLEYNIKSAYRFLSNRDRMFKFERQVLKTLRQLTLLHPGENSLQVMIGFREEMNLILEDPFEQKALKIFDVTAWIDAKIAGKTIAESLQAKKDFAQK